MGVMDAVHGIEQHLKDFAASAEPVVAQHLPEVQKLAQAASANPAVVALLDAVHLQEAPELLQALADEVGKIEAALAAAMQKGAAGAQAQQPAPEAPAEPAPPSA